MTIRVLVHSITPNIRLANIRIIFLSWSRSGIFWWRWKRNDTASGEQKHAVN